MWFRNPIRYLLLCVILVACQRFDYAQEKRNPPVRSEDVVRVETALVQTDVMVFDKQGKFVNGLKRDQFALKVDGKPRDISFLELVQAGTANEELQLAAARGTPIRGGGSPVPLDRGRTVFFFLDDLHLSSENLNRARVLVRHFVEQEMGQNDQVGIVSATGQIGFLQQLTDNKSVLLKAIGRVHGRPYSTRDLQSPQMSEYQAHQIDNNDADVTGYFVDALLRENPNMGRAAATVEVHARARGILQYAASVTTNTLSSLKHLIDGSSVLPGRKILIMVSDGFFLDQRNSDAYFRLHETTAAAAASGLVIYSLDARGLTAGMFDVSVPGNPDPSGRLARSAGGELPASQDGLNALAVDTGGRAFFNTNSMSTAVSTALKETSVYYLLAWRPENEEQRSPRFRRIELAVIGRPELSVRFRRGFSEGGSPEKAKDKSKSETEQPKQGEELRAALRAAYPKTELPISLSVNFLNTPQRGDVVVTSVRLSTPALMFETLAGVPTANVTLAGLIIDDQGKIVDSFEKRITVRSTTPQTTAPTDDVFYNNYSAIRPGLYQVRVAAADDKRHRAGSVQQWIEIPDLSTRSLALSTIIVGERKTEGPTEPLTTQSSDAPKPDNPFPQVNLNVDHRFSRSSYLRLLLFVYNANSGTSSAASSTVPAQPNTSSNNTGRPDLAVQVQVFRDDEPVITDPLHKIDTEGVKDLTRLPYAAELGLSTLQTGRYVLQLTVIDRNAKASASQRFRFEVD
jgi:VWFA-related protein